MQKDNYRPLHICYLHGDDDSDTSQTEFKIYIPYPLI